MKPGSRVPAFGIATFIVQAALIILFAAFVEYADVAKPDLSNATVNSSSPDSLQVYSMFQDVQGMLFLGFGFLMTFLQKYGFGSVGLNFYISAIAIQLALLFNGLAHLKHGKILLDAGSLLGAEFTCASVLITFGAVLGKVNPLQLLIIALIEVPVFAVNEYVGRYILQAADVGDSLFVHAFGAYFGIACSRVIYRKIMHEAPNEGSVYHSDIFAMIGTLILWIFWPSFNAATATGPEQHRAVINTFCSLLACTAITFAVSSLVSWDKGAKLNMVHVQNATLAGGVAIGASADLLLTPAGAMFVGLLAGMLSTLGYQFITPRLNHLGFHDTCGVNNLHGMPAILAGIVSAVMASMATVDSYGSKLYEIFPARANDGRRAAIQGCFQILALLVTLGFAVAGGSLAGFVARIANRNPAQRNADSLYTDEPYWFLPPSGIEYADIPLNEKDSQIPEGENTAAV